MLTDKTLTDLREQGYAVIPQVLSNEECDHVISLYQCWLSQFKDGQWPYSANSLIQRYNTGNMEPTWIVRLKSKKVFAQLWNTDKLLSSVDAIAIGRPPEESEEPFFSLEQQWLHLDQGPVREGLHAYQGAVTLEEILEDDWTLQVIEGSHKFFEEFCDGNSRASIRADLNGHYSLLDEEVKWFGKKGLQIKRVPVPKGGMVLWDSRLVHANACPIKGRKNPGRWRYCVFVSMTPAIWANKEDIQHKKKAYNDALMTTHWSSQGVKFFKTDIPSFSPWDVVYPNELPDIAKTPEARLLSGIDSYDFNSGNPNGEEMRPKWRRGPYARSELKSDSESGKLKFFGIAVTGALVSGLISYMMYKMKHTLK